MDYEQPQVCTNYNQNYAADSNECEVWKKKKESLVPGGKKTS